MKGTHWLKVAGVAAAVLVSAGTAAMTAAPAHAAEARPAWSIGHGTGKDEVFYAIASYHDLHNVQGATLGGIAAACTAAAIILGNDELQNACNSGVAYLSAHRSNDDSNSHGVYFAVYTTSPHVHEGTW